ncbi:MAG: hypothetical protein LLF94_04975 [Chlamydiales bacterium]|nr:hypothetical protein [Chlamydiales bacterium]
MKKLVDEAPYHPGYEDAVVPPNRVYSGVKTGKMLWKPKPLSEEKMYEIAEKTLGHAIGLYNWKIFARAIEQEHGIK